VGKKRVIKRFEQISDELMEKIKETYPDGFEEYLITYTNPKGEIEIALPLETEDTSYLIKMPKDNIPEEVDDFDISSELAKSIDTIDTFEIDKDLESAILGKEFEDVFIGDKEDEDEKKEKSKSKKKSSKSKKLKKSDDFDDDEFDDFDDDFEDEFDEEDYDDESDFDDEEDDEDDNLLI